MEPEPEESVEPSIVKNYNKSITLCRKHPESEEASTNATICGMEEVLGHPVAKKTRRSSHVSLEGHGEPPFYKLMCGCRITTLVLFVMLVFGIETPSGPEFHSLYRRTMGELSDNAKLIIGGCIPISKMKELISGKDQDIKSELESDIDINIVYIFKYMDREISPNYQIFHSFIIRYNQGIYEIFSSWYSGRGEHGETSVTQLIYKTFTFDELKGRLTCESLLNREICEEIFGEGNFFPLGSELKILFIRKTGILKTPPSGKKKKKKKKSKSRKHRKKKKTKRKKKKTKRKKKN